MKKSGNVLRSFHLFGSFFGGGSQKVLNFEMIQLATLVNFTDFEGFKWPKWQVCAALQDWRVKGEKKWPMMKSNKRGKKVDKRGRQWRRNKWGEKSLSGCQVVRASCHRWNEHPIQFPPAHQSAPPPGRTDRLQQEAPAAALSDCAPAGSREPLRQLECQLLTDSWHLSFLPRTPSSVSWDHHRHHFFIRFTPRHSPAPSFSWVIFLLSFPSAKYSSPNTLARPFPLQRWRWRSKLIFIRPVNCDPFDRKSVKLSFRKRHFLGASVVVSSQVYWQRWTNALNVIPAKRMKRSFQPKWTAPRLGHL